MIVSRSDSKTSAAFRIMRTSDLKVRVNQVSLAVVNIWYSTNVMEVSHCFPEGTMKDSSFVAIEAV